MGDVTRKKVVFRFNKVKSLMGLRALLAHNMRLAKPKNADAEREQLNLYSNIDNRRKVEGKDNPRYRKQREGINDIILRYRKALNGIKPRKNAVYAHEYIISGSPEQMERLTEKQQKAYFRESFFWLKEQYGPESKVIHVAWHFDEKTPHAHIVIQPIHKGKLNSSFFVGGMSNRMAEYQTRFAKDVSLKFGFERGDKNSKATHKHLTEYYKLINDDLPGARKEMASLAMSVRKNKEELNKIARRMAKANQEEEEKRIEIHRLRSVVDELKSLIPERGRLAYQALIDAGKRYGMVCDNMGKWFDIPAPKHSITEEHTPREVTTQPAPRRSRMRM